MDNAITQSRVYISIKNCFANNNNETRKEAEQFIVFKKKDNPEIFLKELFSLINSLRNNNTINTTEKLQMKQMCLIIIKNIVNENDTWFKINFTAQNKIKQILYDNMRKDQEDIKFLSMILSTIAYKEYQGGNPSLIENFIQLIRGDNNQINFGYILLIKFFLESLGDNKTISAFIVNSLYDNILQIFNEYHNNGNLNQEFNDIIQNLLSVYNLLIPFLHVKFKNQDVKIFPIIIDILRKSYIDINKIEIIKCCLFTISETISLYYLAIQKLIPQITSLLNEIIKTSNNSTIILSCVDIYCLLGDNELKKETSISRHIISISQDLSTLLLETLLSHTQVVLPEMSEWSISKSICYFLSYLVRLYPDNYLVEKLLIFVSSHFNDENETQRYVSMIVLSCCLETSHKNILETILKNEILNLIEKVNDTNQVLSYTMSWLLGKISEMVPTLYERSKFYLIIPTLVNMISNHGLDAKTRINISIVLGNLISYYGDEKTVNKANSFISYYKLFINNFLDDSVKEANIKNNLSFYLIRIIMNVVQYSSLDFQDRLLIFLGSVLDKYIQIIEMTGGLNFLKLEENLCLVINQIFNKIIRKVDLILCKKVYNAIMMSFKKRNSAYESGMLCLFNIIILLHSNEEPNYMMDDNITCNIADFFYYLKQSINININKDNDLLINSSILTINNLCWIKSNYLQEYSHDILDCIFGILNSPHVLHETKLMAISLIGDMCLNIPVLLEQNIEKIIPLLFSAFDMIAGAQENEVSEYQNLLITLLETFSMILLSLQEKNKERIIFIYIKQLIKYINCFTEQKFSSDVKDNLILLFGDILNLLGERIREFCNKEEVYSICRKLNNNSNDDYFKWMNGTASRIFME